MFDAKSILEGLVRGAAPTQQPASGGGLGDILGDILKGAGAGGAQGGGGLGDILSQIGKQMSQPGANGGGAAPASTGGGGLGDILGQLQRQLGQHANAATPSTGSAAPQIGPQSGPAATGGGLGDILGQLKDKIGQAGGAVTGGGGLADILGQVLSQAAQGTKEGAARIGQATGATDALGRALGGQNADDLLAKLKELVQQNQMAAGGLGGLVLGTSTGRAVAGSAARLGALALIGGLAYKAFQNYQAGKPLITGATQAETAPAGSGFEPAAVTNDSATHYIQAMIAAAAADGRIDDVEQSTIIASLKQAGVDAEAEEFIANELNNPKSVEDLANSVGSPEEAIQLYTAARIAVEPDSDAEKKFLTSLAAALGIDAKLASHIDATTRGASA